MKNNPPKMSEINAAIKDLDRMIEYYARKREDAELDELTPLTRYFEEKILALEKAREVVWGLI